MLRESDGGAHLNQSNNGDIPSQQGSSEFTINRDQLLYACIANSPVVLYGIDKNGIFTLIEGKGLEALGLQAGEVVGKSIFELLCNYPDILANIRLVFAGKEVAWMGKLKDCIYQNRTIPLRVASGEVVGLVGMATDVTQKSEADEQLQLLAATFYDTLTRLPNRAFFLNQLRTCIERSHECPDYLFAVLFLNLDRFKMINDSLGYPAGDKVLVAIADRLRALVKPGDIVARVGGDEFAILLKDIKDIGDVSLSVNRLQTELQHPLELEGQEILTTASIGIAVSMLWYDCPEDILRDADMAMYRAKAQGSVRPVVFNKTMYRQAVNRLQMETDLRQAIPRQELQLYYQPIISLITGRISGFEALVRWQHPTRGLVSPADFIPVAEETGLIIPIGEWVLREACIKAKQWQLAFGQQTPLTINVNLSGRQFVQPHLSAKIDQILRETGIERQSLKLEITESAFIENADWLGNQRAGESVIEILAELRSLGVQLGIDDFGTGYSSLSRLYRFPINTLKIDQSFIKSMELSCEEHSNNSSCKVVRAIIGLAHNLGLDVTAEGIETFQQLEQLRKLGCEFGQGYFFSEPIDAFKAEALIAAQPQW